MLCPWTDCDRVCLLKDESENYLIPIHEVPNGCEAAQLIRFPMVNSIQSVNIVSYFLFYLEGIGFRFRIALGGVEGAISIVLAMFGQPSF